MTNKMIWPHLKCALSRGFAVSGFYLLGLLPRATRSVAVPPPSIRAVPWAIIVRPFRASFGLAPVFILCAFASLRETSAQSGGPYVVMPGILTGGTQATSYESLGHVLVLTNGFSGLTNWISDSVNPLQDALNYYTNFAGPDVAALQSNLSGNSVMNSNPIAPAFEIVGTFYQPGGFTIPNQYVYSSWNLCGDGPFASVLIGNSNVLWAATNSVEGPAAVAAANFYLHGFAFVYSNETAKSVCVYEPGVGCYSHIYDNVFPSYSEWSANGFNTAVQGGGSSAWNIGTANQPGMIGLLVDGAYGQQDIHDNIFPGGADGIVAMSSHARIWNNEFDAVGFKNGSTVTTNQYSTNDVASYFGFSWLQGFELAVGANMVLQGDDIEVHGNKCLGGHVDVAISGGGGSFASGVYGPVIINNEHCEALTGTSPRRDLVFLTASSVPSNVRLHDCFDQNNSDRSWNVWLQTSGYVLTLDSISDTNKAADDSFSQVTGQVEWKVNNSQINPMFYFSTNYIGTMVNGGTLRYTNAPPYAYAAPN